MTWRSARRMRWSQLLEHLRSRMRNLQRELKEPLHFRELIELQRWEKKGINQAAIGWIASLIDKLDHDDLESSRAIAKLRE